MNSAPAIDTDMISTPDDAHVVGEGQDGDVAESFSLAVDYILKGMGHGSQARVAKLSGITSSYLNDMLKQRKRGTEEKRRAITKVLGISYEKVIEFGDRLRASGGVGSTPDQVLGIIKACNSAISEEEFVDVPRVKARLSAGNGSLVVDVEMAGYYKFRQDWISRVSTSPNMLVLMTTSGDSMEPVIPDKAMVLVDQGKTELVVGKTFAVGLEEEILVKRIDKQPGKVILKSWNPAYDPITIDMNNEAEAASFRVIGRVIWMGTAM